MKINSFFALLITQLFFLWIKTVENVKPNIVLIIADDLGWDDVSFHGSDQIQTPNIDALAYSGVILHQFRTHCQCTPSRAALLTGKYAHKIGMQGYPLTNGEDRGLPVEIKILPQYLKELDYSTHLVGKWHLGHSRKVYLPQNRGFDTYFGHRGGFLDYYEYTSEETWTLGKVSGLDLFSNFSAAWDVQGYITDVYTAEAKKIINSHDTTKSLFLQLSHAAPHSANAGSLLQAPPEEVRQMRHVESPQRRIYAAMVKKLDDSVGEIIKTLDEKEILNNTIIIFMSDNGGMTVETRTPPNYASNWPLKGLKMSPWEGGIRVIGTVWSPTITSNIWNGYMHSVDWLPTLLKAVGGDTPKEIDGIDLWDDILNNKESSRKEFVEIDDYTEFSAVIKEKYKLVTGKIDDVYNQYYGEELQGVIGKAPSYIDAITASETFNIFHENYHPLDLEKLKKRNKLKIHCNNFNKIPCQPSNDKHCLYNIEDDPCELVDLSNESKYNEIYNELNLLLNEERNKIIPRHVPLFRDPRALPKLFNYTWTTWHDEIIIDNQ